MTISRMQQPRQMYGLGSLVKKAVKGVTGAVKSFAKSDLGKAAGLAALTFGIPGTNIGGLFGRSGFGGEAMGLFGQKGIGPTFGAFKSTPFGQAIFGKAIGDTDMTRTGGLLNFLKTPGGAFAGITAASALAAAGIDPENPNEMPRNTEALKSYLREGYLTLNPQAQPDEVEEFVEANTVEYRANGGRIGFADGMLSFEEAKAMNPGMFSAEVETDVVRPNTELLNYIKRIRDAVKKGIIPMDFAMDLIKQKTMEQGVDLQGLRDDIMETQRIEQAYGGRMQYGLGDLVRGSSMVQPAGGLAIKLNRPVESGDPLGSYYPDPSKMKTASPIMNPTMNTDGYGRLVNSITGKLLSNFGDAKEKSGDTPIMPITAFTTGTNAVDDRGIDIMPSMPMYGFYNALNNKSKYDTRFGLDQNVVDYLNQSLPDISGIDFIDENFNGIDDRKEAAYGGRMQYAFGNPEQNAINAAGIMNLPLNQNPAGVTELDLRDSGGFIPPVGVKEKADDIPAMLSNNEFVFTADAVRNMGDGNVNKGAQRMYDMMKKLENGGRV
jgi:hypothetical protein